MSCESNPKGLTAPDFFLWGHLKQLFATFAADCVFLPDETWKLSLNATKCKTMSVTLKRNPVQYSYAVRGTMLERLDKMRDLGVILDSKLTFTAHVDSAVSKARRALGVLMRSFSVLSRSERAPEWDSRHYRLLCQCAFHPRIRIPDLVGRS